MWITSLCSLLPVGYRGQHGLNTQVANTQHFGWVFATWVFTTLGIVEVGYSVLLPLLFDGLIMFYFTVFSLCPLLFFNFE